MLTFPKHIRDANLHLADTAYAWDEWKCREYYLFEQPDLFKRLDELTNKANTALTIGIGEWVCARFRTRDRDARPLQFMEAAWAGVVHPAYCQYTETVDDEWRGPVRAPLAIAIVVTNDALFCLADDPNVATRVCWLRNLAQHVIADTGPFDQWFEACVQRLERFHTKLLELPSTPTSLFDALPPQGQPVPREAVNLDFPYDPQQAPTLLNAYLSALKPLENPYLRTPQELQDVDDLGSAPYSYTP
jgi:hypothetical protein